MNETHEKIQILKQKIEIAVFWEKKKSLIIAMHMKNMWLL